MRTKDKKIFDKFNDLLSDVHDGELLKFHFFLDLTTFSTKFSGHFWTGSHVKTILEIPNKMAVGIDIINAGVRFVEYNMSWLPPLTIKKGKTVGYELWTHGTWKEDVQNVLDDISKKRTRSPSYKLAPLFPGKKYGQNCSTYALKLGRKAGYNFFSEKIYGSNPKAVSSTLHRRERITDWSVRYALKG